MPNVCWPATPEEWCARWKRLDREFGTDVTSPLHHDQRCEIHGTDPAHNPDVR